MIMAATFLGSSHFIYFFIYFLGLLDKGHINQWKGFFPYKMDPIPREKNAPGMYQKSTGKIPKYDTKKEDLDFLEW